MAENLREKLDRIDLKCIDEDLRFYDLRSLFEATTPRLSPEDKEEIKKVIQNTDDAETIAAVLQAKAMDKNESLEEDADSLQSRIFDFLDELGGYADYNQRIEEVSDEFGMSPDEAEGYVWDWTLNSEAEWHDTADQEEDESLQEKLVDAPQEVIDKLLEILKKYGFILDDSVGHENPIRSAIFGDVHIQVINPDSQIDVNDEISFDRQMETYISRNMIDEISRLDDEYNCPITWNFGPNNKGQVTGGLDIMKQYIPDEVDESLNESIKPVGGDGNYFVFYVGPGYPSYQEVEDFGRNNGCTVIWWGSDEAYGYRFKANYNGDTLVVAKDIDKLPDGYKQDAKRYGEPLSESFVEKLDLSDYEELSYPLRDGGKNYQLFRKLENGKGKWAAAPIIMGDVKYDDAFEITYDQARGFEPINTIGKLSRDLGKVLLPKRESIKESSELTDEDWEDFYKLEEEIANVMHGIDSDLDDAQANIYHDDSDGTRRLTFRFVCGVNKISDKTRKQIIIALENYLNKTKFNQFIYIRLYPIEVPVGASYEVIINAETEPDENLTEASYGGAYDIEDDMYFTKEDMMEFIDELLQKLKDEFGYDFEIYAAGFDTPTDLYIELIDDHGALVDNHVIIDMRKIKTPADLVHKYLDSTFKMFKDDFQDVYKDYNSYDESVDTSDMRKQVFDFLDEIGGYTDYNGKIEELMREFNMTRDEAAYWIDRYVLDPDGIDEELYTDDDIPYTYEQMEKELKSATNNWTKDNFEGWVGYTDEFDSAMQILSHHYENVDNLGHTHRGYGFFATRPSLFEDTVKQDGKWVNKGKEGTHGKFATKKAADAQRRAIWVNWNK